MSQADFGAAIGVSQGNVSHYELDRQEVPPDVARRIKAAAEERGIDMSFDDIYGQDGDLSYLRSTEPSSPKPRPRASGSGAKKEGPDRSAAAETAGTAQAGAAATACRECGSHQTIEAA